MKKVIAFLLLCCICIVMLTFPTYAAPAPSEHPLPLWSILCYLAAVGLGAVIAFGMSQEQEETAEKKSSTWVLQ